jgi:hypothetical protein
VAAALIQLAQCFASCEGIFARSSASLASDQQGVAVFSRSWRVAVDAEINLKINGSPKTVKTNPERMLLDVLREDLHLTGTSMAAVKASAGRARS